jgi:uroporphyrinogen-III synthase
MRLINSKILITRPDTLAQPLIQALETMGAQVCHAPALKIQFLSDDPKVQQAIQQLTAYSWHIFVSRHAVQAVLPQIVARWSMLDLKQLHWAAVGPGTAKELASFIDCKIVYPHTGLGARALQVELEDKMNSSDTALIWCGDEPTVVWPGMQSVMCYRREKNAIKLHGVFDYIVVTSGSSLECLEVDKLNQGKLIVISERLVLLARTLGFKGEIILAQGADDQSIIQAIKGN